MQVVIVFCQNYNLLVAVNLKIPLQLLLEPLTNGLLTTTPQIMMLMMLQYYAVFLPAAYNAQCL